MKEPSVTTAEEVDPKSYAITEKYIGVYCYSVCAGWISTPLCSSLEEVIELITQYKVVDFKIFKLPLNTFPQPKELK